MHCSEEAETESCASDKIRKSRTRTVAIKAGVKS